MEIAMVNRFFQERTRKGKAETVVSSDPNLTHAERDRSYTIREIRTSEQAMKDFLFSLGCFEGEEITVISVLSDNYIIHVQNARYSIDADLARAIRI